MRIPSTLLLLIVCFQCFSQNNDKGSARVEYKIINNTGLPNTLYATLFINNEVSIYFEKYSTKKHIDQSGNENVVVLPPLLLFEPYTNLIIKRKRCFFLSQSTLKFFWLRIIILCPTGL